MRSDRLPSHRPWSATPGAICGLLLLSLLAVSCIHFPGRQRKTANAREMASQPTATNGQSLPAPRPGTGNASGIAKIPRPLPSHRIGTVRTVGTGSRFVLVEIITADANLSIGEGQELRCVPPGGGNAGPATVVRISREHRPPFLVADVLSGDPRAGDDVYFSQGSSAMTSPAPTPPVTSFLVPSSLFPPPSPAPRTTP